MIIDEEVMKDVRLTTTYAIYMVRHWTGKKVKPTDYSSFPFDDLNEAYRALENLQPILSGFEVYAIREWYVNEL